MNFAEPLKTIADNVPKVYQAGYDDGVAAGGGGANPSEIVENLPIALDFSDGDQEIVAPDGVLVKSAIIQKPETLNPENIAEGVNIAGIVGTLAAGGGTSDELCYVTFMSYDGSVEYGKKAVAVGDDCADPIARGIFETPTRESDAQYNYTFAGWAMEANGGLDNKWNKAVTEDRTVYANYISAVRYYTVTYYDSDGITVLKTESLAYGSTPNYTPEKDGYKFTAWTPELAEVTGDSSYVSSWVEQLVLADYTWAQIDAMTLEEAQEAFKIGDAKDDFVLVGYNHDVLSDGTKAKMSFISKALTSSMTLYSARVTYTDLNLYVQMNGNPKAFINRYSDELAAVAKPVQKQYLTDRTTGSALSTVTNAFWFPSATELGYKTDGSVVFTEGTRYEFFAEKNISDKIETWNGVDVDYIAFRLGNLVLRSGNANGWLYLKSGVLATATANVSSCYCFVGFCI